MNPVLNPIFHRRSIRKYTEQAITEEQGRDLLEAAMAAPSACATDPWRFIVTRDKALLGKIADGLPHGQMLRSAGLGVVVCGDMDAAHDGQESYMLQDCSAAIQNLLLAADMLGLGAVWLGVHPREDRITHLRDLFDLPATIVPVSAIAVGYPAEEKPARTRHKAEHVHAERW